MPSRSVYDRLLLCGGGAEGEDGVGREGADEGGIGKDEGGRGEGGTRRNNVRAAQTSIGTVRACRRVSSWTC